MQPNRAPPLPPPPSSATASATWQTAARALMAVIVIGAGIWILSDFLAALAWAAVFAIALWPSYRLLLQLLPGRSERVLGPLVATLLIAAIIIAPLVLLGIAIAREAHIVIALIAEARNYGIPAPQWIHNLPVVGPPLAEWWRDHLSDPELAQEMFGQIKIGSLTSSARHYGAAVVHRVAILGFTLMTLFFLFRDGNRLTAQLRGLSDRMIGRRGERVGAQMIAAVHGTVTGLVLVGLVEGILLGIAYFAVGLPYPALVGAATGVAAVIPFAAPAVYLLAALYLLSAGNMGGALIVALFGSAVVFVADHFVRPVLIGGAARLPFLLVLLGILGGLETLGLVGLFLGPAIMAALVALWREWTGPEPVGEQAPSAATAAAMTGRVRPQPPPARRPGGARKA
jgi:predicted PurR-regulated permease PerM